MVRTHRRQAVLAAVAFVAATALLTGCQGDDQDTADAAKPGRATPSTAGKAPAAKTPEARKPEAKKPADGGDTGTDKDAGAAPGKGTGTWFGNVSYFAPGKYTVSDMKGVEQAFWLAEDTDIEGSGDICGDENGQAATPCTEAELEAAAKKGFSAEVKLKDGIAISIIDDH